MSSHTESKSPPLLAADKLAKAERKPRNISFVSLSEETRVAVSTACAAFHLSRAEQTLRVWAMTGHPIAPLRINGRLSWRVTDLRRLLGVA